jgi:prolyl-tRNA synthetase
LQEESANLTKDAYMNTLPDIKKDFAGWYQEIVSQAELADHAPVRGAMVIRPYGYAIWENIKGQLDKRIKETGHVNAAFPLFIPESFLKREAEHIAGFAPELAVVTHAGGKLLEEPLVVRPTSETIIHFMFAKWIKSWRDLPLKINQWANVVRWEMRPRPFIRTTEFFWQEGHTAHATQQEANDEAYMMLQEYQNLCTEFLAIPVITGRKSDSEKFPGAVFTLTFEGLMQDGKALQMGTSHMLSQSFAHSFEMKFQDQNGNLSYPYLTSWGATTRLIGAVIMVHGDAKGLVIPPRIAPIQVVIIPILRKGHDNQPVLDKVAQIKQELEAKGVKVHVDADDSKSPGAKFYHWELRGVPLRVEIGPRDLEQNVVIMADRLTSTKRTVAIPSLNQEVPQLLDLLHIEMLALATKRRDQMWYEVAKLSEFGPLLDEKPGFYQTGWCGSAECETQLKSFKATTRCVLDTQVFSECFHCSAPNKADVLIAKSY